MERTWARYVSLKRRLTCQLQPSTSRRLQWQMDNLDRGLHFIPLHLSTAKLFIFVGGSFANNSDLSSRIGYVVVFGNETHNDGEFLLRGNIVHWSSTKCKRVTRAVLASELHAMVAGIDMAISISTTLKLITEQLKLRPIPVIICTDSFSLYECMVKLSSALRREASYDRYHGRQSYERRELSEIRCINGNSNPAATMTNTNIALQLHDIVWRLYRLFHSSRHDRIKLYFSYRIPIGRSSG